MATQNERFAAWFREQLARREWEQADFVRASGTSTANASRWFSGIVPATESIALIARTFAVPVDEIYAVIGGDEDEKPPRSPDDILAEYQATKPVVIPVIRDLIAHMGAGGGFIDDYVFLPPQYRARRRKGLRGIVARGECMEPKIEDGDAVIFDLDAKWKPGDAVVAAVDGHVLVRRLIEVSGRLALRADKDGETHILNEGDQIYGKVLGVQRMFDI